MTVNVDILGSPSLIVLVVTVDVKYCESMVVVEPQNLFLFISFPAFSIDVFYTFFVCMFLYSTLCLRPGMGICTIEMPRIIILKEEVPLGECHQLTAACTQVSKITSILHSEVQTWNHN